MRYGRTPLLLPAFLALAVTPAHALVIIPTFDNSITSDPNAAAIEAGINHTLSTYETTFLNPITVNITFQEMPGGLGESDTYLTQMNYSTYWSDLVSDKQGTGDTAFLQYLPNQTANPVSGTSSIFVSTADYKALTASTGTGTDGTISLNTSAMNLSRTGPQNSGDYDLQSVASHEIDEVLGTSSYLGDSFAPNPASGYDLFRYTAPGVRATTATASNVYFSVDGGQTAVKDQYGNAIYFNPDDNGGDLGDYASSSRPRVQDAFGTPGSAPSLGPGEMTALQDIGYNAAIPNASAAPEPSSLSVLALIGLSLGAVLWRARWTSCRKATL